MIRPIHHSEQIAARNTAAGHRQEIESPACHLESRGSEKSGRRRWRQFAVSVASLLWERAVAIAAHSAQPLPPPARVRRREKVKRLYFADAYN